MERKTLLTHSLQIVRFDHLSWCASDSNIRAIQVLDHKVDTSQSLNKRDLLFKKDIGTLPFELLVRLFLYNNDDIAGLDSWCLISLTVESVLAIVWCTLIDHRVENLLFFVHLFTFTRRAFSGLINDLTLTIAVIARALGLGVHAGS